MFVLWFLLVFLNLLELILQKAYRDPTDTDSTAIETTGKCDKVIKQCKAYIPLLFAIVGFAVPIILLYQQRFQKDSFCT